MAHFNPTTERQRIYAACVDWRNADEYLSHEFSDRECAIVARALLGAVDRRVGPEVVVKTLLDAVPMMRDVQDVGAVLNITKPRAAWWCELIAECNRVDARELAA